MTCGKCPEGRRFAKGSTYCRMYGMILREEHECTRRGGNRHDAAGGTADNGEDGENSTELQENGSGAA